MQKGSDAKTVVKLKTSMISVLFEGLACTVNLENYIGLPLSVTSKWFGHCKSVRAIEQSKLVHIHLVKEEVLGCPIVEHWCKETVLDVHDNYADLQITTYSCVEEIL